MLSYAQGDQGISNSMAKMCSLARAKYDNLAESPDELAFRRGDVLTVIDQKFENLDGWWLCSFRGRQGIVPANRVTLLAGMYYESALRFSTSPESSISDGGGVDYDVPKSDPANRKLPPVPGQSSPAKQQPIRELVYDIPKSLEKTRIHQNQVRQTPPPPADNVYDTPPSHMKALQVTAAGLAGSLSSQRKSSGPMSPIYKSGDSAVDMRSNRSSMMSNTSSPPGSSVCDYSRNSMEMLDVYDTPTSIRVRQSPSKYDIQPAGADAGLYDVPKTIRETLREYESRDSGVYDNARLSGIHTSPSKDFDVYDHPVSSHISVHRPSSGSSTTLNSGSSTRPASQETANLYDVLPLRNTNHLVNGFQSLDLDNVEKLTLGLEEAMEIIVKLQQHVETSTGRLLSFLHAKWRARANLESVLYDLKMACVGLQTTLQEFYDFGAGALVNSISLKDQTIKQRLIQALNPLKLKLDIVNGSMKALSSIKWHLAKLEDSYQGTEGNDLVKLVSVAREVGENVSRVASVIHGNSRLLFIPNNSSSGRLSEVRGASLDRVDSPVGPHTIDYNEYDYCDIEVRVEEPAPNPPQSSPSAITISPHAEQDCKYLQYYSHHVQAICESVRGHVLRLQTVVETGQSNQTLVSVSKLLVASAHKLVYIGDTLSRSLRQPNVQSLVSEDANTLCNVLKDFIMCTKEAALAEPASRPAALNKLKENIGTVQRQTKAFHDVISTQASKAAAIKS